MISHKVSKHLHLLKDKAITSLVSKGKMASAILINGQISKIRINDLPAIKDPKTISCGGIHAEINAIKSVFQCSVSAIKQSCILWNQT